MQLGAGQSFAVDIRISIPEHLAQGLFSLGHVCLAEGSETLGLGF